MAPGESPGAVVLCGTPSGMADLLRGAPAAPHQLVILTDDCDLPASDRTVVVARPVGGGATRVAAAFVALGGALAKHPERRGAALLETVRGELAVPTGPRGDIPQHGWQVRPRRPLSRPSGPATAGHHEFAVLGGGMVGRAAAAELAEAGASVVLVDDGTPGSSASAVSGGLVRAFELDEGERNLACEAFLALWGRPELATAHGFRRTGALVLLGPHGRGKGRGLRQRVEQAGRIGRDGLRVRAAQPLAGPADGRARGRGLGAGSGLCTGPGGHGRAAGPRPAGRMYGCFQGTGSTPSPPIRTAPPY